MRFWKHIATRGLNFGPSVPHGIENTAGPIQRPHGTINRVSSTTSSGVPTGQMPVEDAQSSDKPERINCGRTTEGET